MIFPEKMRGMFHRRSEDLSPQEGEEDELLSRSEELLPKYERIS